MTAYLRPFCCAFLLALGFTSYAQDFLVSGKVVDADKQPISFANVVLLNGTDSTFVKGTSTDNKGIYEFLSVQKGEYFIKTTFIGFKSVLNKQTILQDIVLDDIVLLENSETLNQVDIIARKPTITRKPDRLIFNIENTALVEGNTLQVLKNTPGIIVIEGSINIKSAPAVVYINNRRVQLTSNELIQLLESAPANSIKSVEVITNPPASYDADSGSVINIIMSKNLVTGYRGSVFTNYTQGVFPRYNAGTNHYFKNNKINVNVNYSYTNKKINRDNNDVVNYLDDNNNIDEIYNSNVNRNTYSETHNLNFNFDYFIDKKNTLSLTSTGLYTPYFKYKINNNTNITDENSNFLSRFTADNLSRDDKHNIGTDLTFRHDFDNGSNLSLNGHYTIYDYERDQNVLSNFFDENNMFESSSEFNTIANQDTEIFTAKADYNLPIDNSATFEAGVKYSNVSTESNIARLDIINGNEILNAANSDAFDYNEHVYAAYANLSKSWSKWDFNAGLRVEQSEIEGTSLSLGETNFQDYLNWFPNASLSYQLSDEVSVNGSYKRSIYRPSYTDLNPFTFFLNENTVVRGNPNLKPAYRDHYKVGVDFLKYFTVEAYYMNYDGNIVELPRQNNDTNVIAFTPTNLDKKVDYGFDFAFYKYITSRYFLYAVTSFYNISEETDFGEGFVELSQWSNYSVLQNSLSFLEDNSLNVNLTFTWVGKSLQRLQTVENRLVSELSVSKRVFNDKGVITLAVEDLFNLQDYETSTDYLNQSSSSFIDSDNRSIKLGFRYKFGNTKLKTNERTTSAEERQRLKDLN